MIDQSHNLKGKIEATVQTVVTAQELWLKAALVDREAAGAVFSSPATWSPPKSSSAAHSGTMSAHSPRHGAKRAACPPIRWPPCAPAAMSSASAASAAAARPQSTATPEIQASSRCAMQLLQLQIEGRTGEDQVAQGKNQAAVPDSHSLQGARRPRAAGAESRPGHPRRRFPAAPRSPRPASIAS